MGLPSADAARRLAARKPSQLARSDDNKPDMSVQVSSGKAPTGHPGVLGGDDAGPQEPCSVHEAEAERYRAMATAMLKLGATLQPMLPGPMDRHPVVRAALNEALAAHRDAKRRLQARRDRAAQAADAEERRELFEYMASAQDRAGFRAWIAKEEERRGWMLQSVEDEPRHVRATAYMRYAVHIRRCRADWDKAVTLARHRDDAAFWEAARRRGQPIVIVPPTPEDTVASLEPSHTWPVGIPMPSYEGALYDYDKRLVSDTGQPFRFTGSGKPFTASAYDAAMADNPDLAGNSVCYANGIALASSMPVHP